MNRYWTRMDNFLSKNMEFCCFGLIAFNFGLWQKNVNAGVFVLISLTTAYTIWRKRITERAIEDDFGDTLDQIMDKLGRDERRAKPKQQLVLFKPGDPRITH